MKFGLNYHKHQVPEWSSYYVQYHKLKHLIKAGQSGTTELIACLNENVGIFNEASIRRCQSIESQIERYDRIYSSGLHMTNVDSSTSQILELEHIKYHTMHIQESLEKLGWYNRLNIEAIDRIFIKVDRFQRKGSSLEVLQNWHHIRHSSQQRLSELFGKFRRLILPIQSMEMRKATGVALSPKSLLLANFEHYSSDMEIDIALRAVTIDDKSMLEPLFGHAFLNDNKPILRALLHLSAICGSTECLMAILDKAASLCHLMDHDFWVDLLLSRDKTQVDLGVELCLLHVLESMNVSEQRNLVESKDGVGCNLLHYCALTGKYELSKLMLKAFHDLRLPMEASIGVLMAKDFNGCTPVDYAIISDKLALINLFVKVLQSTPRAHFHSPILDVSNRILKLAVESDSGAVYRSLITEGIIENLSDKTKEPLLFVATRTGRLDYVRLIIEATSATSEILDSKEDICGWTSLFIASIYGYEDIIEYLLQIGADASIIDKQGWTAQDHAVFRGYLSIGSLLAKESLTRKELHNTRIPISSKHYGLIDEPRKRCSNLIITLGVSRHGESSREVDIQCDKSSKFPWRKDQQWVFSLELSVPESTSFGEARTHLIPLPTLSDMSQQPFTFALKDGCDPKLVFKIFRTELGSNHGLVLVGTGISLLDSYKRCFGKNRESLIRDQKVPILETESGEMMAIITFTCLFAQPCFDLSQIAVSNDAHNELRNPKMKMRVVGHRGFGQNTAERNHLQIGENTVESFLMAHKAGASMVEFDVQLTKDLVPVIYHDFSLSESGTDVAIHDISLSQFLYASQSQSPLGYPVSVTDIPDKSTSNLLQSSRKYRSFSMSKEHDETERIRARMKLTVDFSAKGFKPNTRGDCIQDSLVTLKDLLIKLPKKVGFNAEIKYPRLHEAVDAGVAPVAIEINIFVDKALETVYKYGSDRQIIFSSFTPEVCILLALKQAKYPVMFITNAGRLPINDLEKRGTSIQTAIGFAKRWQLSGLVFAAEPLVMSPILIRLVKDSGLACASYGPLNASAENIKIQSDAGLDILMGDRVGQVVKALSELDLQNHTNPG